MEPSEDDLVRIDNWLLDGDTGAVSRLLFEERGWAISDLIRFKKERVDWLISQRREDFTVDLDGYWDGHYS